MHFDCNTMLVVFFVSALLVAKTESKYAVKQFCPRFDLSPAHALFRGIVIITVFILLSLMIMLVHKCNVAESA